MQLWQEPIVLGDTPNMQQKPQSSNISEKSKPDSQ